MDLPALGRNLCKGKIAVPIWGLVFLPEVWLGKQRRSGAQIRLRLLKEDPATKGMAV